MGLLARFVRWLWNLLPWSPYGTKPRRGQYRVRWNQDGQERVEDSADVLAYVSRHGFQERGVTCPVCGHLAARPGDWGRVHLTRLGECVLCEACKRQLMACPDDDIDPVKPGEKYDAEVFHKFIRPQEGKPRQRTTAAPIEVGDTVVLENFATTIRGKIADLDRAEGLAEDVGKDDVAVRIQSFNLLQDVSLKLEHGGSLVLVPKKNVFKVITPTIRPGDDVEVTFGSNAGDFAKVLGYEKGRFQVTGKSGTYWVPIERVKRFDPQERLP